MEATEQEKTELYLQYHDKVQRYLQGQVNDRMLAEDLASEVFLKVYSKLDTFDESRASISTWIYTITKNTLTDYYRTRRVNGEIPETFSDEEDIPVDEEICREESLKTLAAALESLNERERDILILRYHSGKTLREIAATMGISYAYVKILRNKALDALKTFF